MGGLGKNAFSPSLPSPLAIANVIVTIPSKSRLQGAIGIINVEIKIEEEEEFSRERETCKILKSSGGGSGARILPEGGTEGAQDQEGSRIGGGGGRRER